AATFSSSAELPTSMANWLWLATNSASVRARSCSCCSSAERCASRNNTVSTATDIADSPRLAANARVRRLCCRVAVRTTKAYRRDQAEIEAHSTRELSAGRTLKGLGTPCFRPRCAMAEELIGRARPELRRSTRELSAALQYELRMLMG